MWVQTLKAQLPINVEQDESRISDVDYSLTNNGIFGFNAREGSYGFFSPRDSGTHYLFGSGLWFGAKKREAAGSSEFRKFSFITFNLTSATSWATPGEALKSEPNLPFPALFYSPDYDTTGENINDKSRPRWPLWLFADEKPSPMRPGRFALLAGQRFANDAPFNSPAYVQGVSEQFVARYHDMDLSNYELAEEQARELGYPLGLQIEQNVYSWMPGREQNKHRAVLIQYRIVNVSADTLFDCYAGQASDPDIGDAANDFQSFVLSARLALTWSATETEQTDMLAQILIEAPMIDDDGFVDNSRRTHFRTRGEVGTFQNLPSDLILRSPDERYDRLDNTILASSEGPDDWRSLIGSKPFHMAPGDTAHMAIAFAVSEPWNPVGDVPDALLNLVEELMLEYYETGFAELPISTVAGRTQAAQQLAPNPASDHSILQFTLHAASDLRIEISDNLGNISYSTHLPSQPAGMFRYQLPVHHLPTGTYLVRVSTARQSFTTPLTVLR